jgi:hypothetical protein
MAYAAVGRADLLRCLHAEGRDALTAMAGFAGYDRRRSVPKRRSVLEQPMGARSFSPTDLTEPSGWSEPDTGAVHGVTFYRVAGFRPITRELPPLGARLSADPRSLTAVNALF